MTGEVMTPPDYDSPFPPGWTASRPFDEVAAAFVTALGELDEVSRNRTADVGTYTYRYADLADALGQARPILAAQGLALFQVPVTATGTVIVATTVMHTSGQWIAFDPLQLVAQGTPQTIGSAITYARRYAAMGALGLASEDDDGAAAGRGQSPPVLLSMGQIDRFRTAAGEHELDGDDIAVVVARATDGRTDDIEQVWGSEWKALQAAFVEWIGQAPGDAAGEGDAAPPATTDPSPDGEQLPLDAET